MNVWLREPLRSLFRYLSLQNPFRTGCRAGQCNYGIPNNRVSWSADPASWESTDRIVTDHPWFVQSA
jgi:hypothetical protein